MSTAVKDFVISRAFDIPREQMWKLWTEPAHMQHWWGPKGFKAQVHKLELRPGGIYHYSLQPPAGPAVWGKFVYREIAKPEKMVFINSFSDADCGITRHPYSATWPLEMLSAISFAEHAGKTTVTVCWTPHEANEIERKTFEEAHAGMQQGWGGTFDQLQAYVEKLNEGK